MNEKIWVVQRRKCKCSGAINGMVQREHRNHPIDRGNPQVVLSPTPILNESSQHPVCEQATLSLKPGGVEFSQQHGLKQQVGHESTMRPIDVR